MSLQITAKQLKINCVSYIRFTFSRFIAILEICKRSGTHICQPELRVQHLFLFVLDKTTSFYVTKISNQPQTPALGSSLGNKRSNSDFK